MLCLFYFIRYFHLYGFYDFIVFRNKFTKKQILTQLTFINHSWSHNQTIQSFPISLYQSMLQPGAPSGGISSLPGVFFITIITAVNVPRPVSSVVLQVPVNLFLLVIIINDSVVSSWSGWPGLVLRLGWGCESVGAGGVAFGGGQMLLWGFLFFNVLVEFALGFLGDFVFLRRSGSFFNLLSWGLGSGSCGSLVSETVDGRGYDLVINNEITVNLLFLHNSFLSLVFFYFLDLFFFFLLLLLPTKLLNHLITSINRLQEFLSDQNTILGNLIISSIEVDSVLNQ